MSSNPSLAIRQRGNSVLVHCHAGCEQDRVIDVLKSRGLWQSKSEWLEWRDGIHYHVTWGRPVQEYQYTDENGRHLYSIVRFAPKDFKPLYHLNGKWTWKKCPSQVLYHLPEVLEAPIVFVVEGERDVETLRNNGFVATTNAGGADAPWLPEFTKALQGREVILIPDRDKPGRQRVKRIARELGGKVSRGVILELEDGHDVTEWFERGHSELELIALLDGEEVSK